MAVSDTTSIISITRNYVPSVDLRDPVGAWVARLSITGDASGGTATYSLTPTLAQVRPQLWSIDNISLDPGVAPTLARVSIRPGPAISGLRPLVGIGMVLTSDRFASSSRTPICPVLLDATDLTWFCDVVIDNPGAAVTSVVSWWGRVWDRGPGVPYPRL